MPKARIDRATVSMRAAVNWILFDDVDRPAESLQMSRCPSADELKAGESLLVALRDAELWASGRFSNTPAAPWEVPQLGRAWTMHSRWPTRIACDSWQRGTYGWLTDTLDVPSGQYIDIQVPRFMIEAIWPPDPKPPPQVASDEAERPYTTPYVELMQQAIAELRITACRQPKKETIMEWFRGQKINDRQISDNHVRHLATFVRLPETQRGGNSTWSTDPRRR